MNFLCFYRFFKIYELFSFLVNRPFFVYFQTDGYKAGLSMFIMICLNSFQKNKFLFLKIIEKKNIKKNTKKR